MSKADFPKVAGRGGQQPLDVAANPEVSKQDLLKAIVEHFGLRLWYDEGQRRFEAEPGFMIENSQQILGYICQVKLISTSTAEYLPQLTVTADSPDGGRFLDTQMPLSQTQSRSVLGDLEVRDETGQAAENFSAEALKVLNESLKGGFERWLHEFYKAFEENPTVVMLIDITIDGVECEVNLSSRPEAFFPIIEIYATDGEDQVIVDLIYQYPASVAAKLADFMGKNALEIIPEQKHFNNFVELIAFADTDLMRGDRIYFTYETRVDHKRVLCLSKGPKGGLNGRIYNLDRSTWGNWYNLPTLRRSLAEASFDFIPVAELPYGAEQKNK